MIKRDGFNVSLWQAHSNPYLSSQTADHSSTFDVIIAGGGITGISTAFLLQEAGKKCLLLEAENIGFGTTGGTTAHLNTLLDTPYNVIRSKFNQGSAELVAAATTDAINLIRNHTERFKIECDFQYKEAYLFAQDEKQQNDLEEIHQSVLDVNLSSAFTETIPVPIPFTKAIKVSRQAQFNPLPYIYALAREFEALGGTIIQNCRVISASVSDNIVDVETSYGNFKAADIVYATHTAPGINLLHLRLVPYRSYAMAFELNDGEYPNGLVYDMYDPYHYYRTQTVEGRNYLIAGGEDHKTGHEENTDNCFVLLEAHVRKHFNIRNMAYKWSAQFFESADGLPYIGHLPGHSEHVYVATGFGGNGMTYSSVAALVLRDMILQKDNAYISLFSPGRIKPIAGFSNFISHNADVARLFLGKFFSAEKLEALAELAPGDGKIIQYEGQRMALYKSEEGKLSAVSPACTHMKCNVKWNGTERTWDCPCHGARYNVDGTVVTGPSSHNLEQISLTALMAEEINQHSTPNKGFENH